MKCIVFTILGQVTPMRFGISDLMLFMSTLINLLPQKKNLKNFIDLFDFDSCAVFYTKSGSNKRMKRKQFKLGSSSHIYRPLKEISELFLSKKD